MYMYIYIYACMYVCMYVCILFVLKNKKYFIIFFYGEFFNFLWKNYRNRIMSKKIILKSNTCISRKTFGEYCVVLCWYVCMCVSVIYINTYINTYIKCIHKYIHIYIYIHTYLLIIISKLFYPKIAKNEQKKI